MLVPKADALPASPQDTATLLLTTQPEYCSRQGSVKTRHIDMSMHRGYQNRISLLEFKVAHG